MAFDPTGCTLAFGKAEGSVELWKVPSGKLLRTLKGQRDGVRTIAFDATGSTLASGSHDGINLWECRAVGFFIFLNSNDLR